MDDIEDLFRPLAVERAKTEPLDGPDTEHKDIFSDLETECDDPPDILEIEPRSSPIWAELEDLRRSLAEIGDLDAVRAFITAEMGDDVLDLQKKYAMEFGALLPTDPIRLEVLQTLAEMGILVY